MPSSMLPATHPYYNASPKMPGVAQPVAAWPGIISTLTNHTIPFSGTMGSNFTFIAGNGSMGNDFHSFGSGAMCATKITVAVSGIYKLVLAANITAAVADDWTAQVQIAVDQIFVQVPPAVGDGFVQHVTNVDPTSLTTADYTWYIPILAGVHQVQIRTYGGFAGPGELLVQTMSMSLFRTGLAPEPVGSRNPTLQPMSSHHFVNTPIGSGAVWSAGGDADTVLLNTGLGIINGTQWSMPVYTGATSDPLQTWECSDVVYATQEDTTLRMPVGMVVAPPIVGGDHAITLFGNDTANRFMHSGFSADVLAAPGEPGVFIGRSQISDMFNGFNHATGQGSGQQPGLIRSWEVLAGSIDHMLIMGLSTTLVKDVVTPWTDLVWPNWEADYNGAFGAYTGGASGIQYGITVGIPASVDITSLGLTAPGLILARCLQDYGAYHAITGGQPNPQVTVFAEQDTSLVVAELTDMASDWNSILLPQLRILRNQGPLTINGGGTRRRAMLSGVAA